MHVSSPDLFAPGFQSKMFVDIDSIEDSNVSTTGEYASEIFAYLREAEVRKIVRLKNIYVTVPSRNQILFLFFFKCFKMH